MRILFCSPQPITHYLGISRVLIELSKELNQQGHDTRIIGPEDLGLDGTNFTNEKYKIQYREKLKKYILNHSQEFDIIDYDHEFLPFDRSLFPKEITLVARTVLLTQHLEEIQIPKKKTIRSFLGKIKNRKHFKERISTADKTVLNADILNVPNKRDKDLLIKKGIDKEKIVVIPYGYSEERLNDFTQCKALPPKQQKIAFLGTFDYRKGAMHFNSIFKKIKKSMPDIEFKIIGAKGLFQTKEEILSFFDQSLHSSIEIILTFKREEIGDYLEDCTLGIYPSYIEGFPFGIIEMQLAYLPVIAFDSPGADMMLKESFRVPVGNEILFSEKIIDTLKNSQLEVLRSDARKDVSHFTWSYVAQETINHYQNIINKRDKK